ncbi:MAG: phosphotransferase [Eubacteriales bacterium]
MTLSDLVKRTPVDKGWSGDKKYCAETADGTKYLLRTSEPGTYEQKKAEFERRRQVESLGVCMCRPLAFGRTDEFVYSIQTWIDGQDAEEVLPFLSDTEQYVYGLKAGRMLKKIHSIPAPSGQEDWEPRFNRKMDRKIQGYYDCPLRFDGAENMIRYLRENRSLLHGRPQSFQHGDYHVGNMMIDRDGNLTVLDFNRFDYGDPWEEFNRIVWCAQCSPRFASGMVNGYFDGDVPMEFWRLLALYLSSNTLSSIYWAIPFGQKEIDTMMNQAREILEWYDNMKNPVPTWYFRGYYLQEIDGILYKLKEPYPLDFIRQFGRVFKIFDDQDSGNLCFGVEREGERYFVKFAGAPTEQYDGTPAEAVARLRATVPVYRALRHPNLVELVDALEVGGGYAVVFRWADGDCMGRMYPAEHRKIMALPTEKKLALYRDLLDFLRHTAASGYVAVDFYDGSVLYDADSGKTTVCDVDLFRKMPAVNDMGRMWGSARFQAPEEYRMGAVIDEVTNVYTAGAMAFALFGEYQRTRDAWTLSDAAYQTAKRAVREERSDRPPSMEKWIREWEAAL